MDADPPPFQPGFLNGGGVSAGRIMARDWSDHPLGPPQGWPEALRAALALVLNSPESMILCWDPDALFFFFNDAYQPLLGPRVDWAMGARFDEVWADAVDQARPIIADAFAGRSTRFEDLPWKLARYGREEDTWFSFSYSRVLDGEGRIAGLFILTSETTERYLGQQRLAEAADLLDRAQRAGGIGLFSVDAAGTVRATPEFARLYGVADWSPAMPSAVFERLVVAEDRAQVSSAEGRAAGQVPLDVEYRIHRADTGELRWIARRGEVERDATGAILRFIGVARDVTEQAETRAALAVANRQLAELVEDRTRERDRLWTLSRDPFLIAAQDGTWLSASPAWSAILGWSEAELVGRRDDWIAHPDDRARNRGQVDLLAAGGEVSQFENRYRTRAGDYRWFSWTAVAADDRLFCVARDVTDEKRRAAELARAEDQLRQSQKVEAVGQLTGGVAHDFNNLLTVIRGSVDLLRRPDLPAGRRERYIDAIADTAERATRLTGQLLAFARRQALRPEVFDVGASVLALREMIATLSGARIALVFDVPDAPVFIDADRNQFDTTLVNMAANARDAMAGEGRLAIRVATVDRMPALRAHAAIEAAFVTVALTDTGTGIDEDRIDRIFEPFYTTKPVGEGTGLGLSQVFGFAKQSGGDILVESAAGAGATFTLYLPRVAAPDRADAAAPPTAASAPMPSATILVVEDHPDVGRFAVQALADLGHRSVLVTDGAAALVELGRDGARFDLVFTDVVMPGMSGIDLAEAVQRLRPGLPILLASGYSEVLAASGTRFALLHKPYSVEALAAAIAAAIGAGPRGDGHG